MKSEYWILLGLGAYWIYSRSAPGAAPFTYPGSPATGSTYRPPVTGSSGGGMPSGGGGGGGGIPSGGVPSGGNQATFNTSTGLFTCADGTEVNDASLCPVDTSGYITCPDGSLVNDPSLCPAFVGPTQTDACGNPMDSGDPCDPCSFSYDPTQCGSAVTTDSMDPCDPSSVAYDPSQCGTAMTAGGL